MAIDESAIGEKLSTVPAACAVKPLLATVIVQAPSLSALTRLPNKRQTPSSLDV
jgi:hypothetical protein